MLDLFQEIYQQLQRNKMRTIATGFAVTSGLFLLIVLQGAGNGLIHSFEYNLRDFAFDAIKVFGGRTTMPFEGVKEGRSIRLDNRDVNMAKHSFTENVTHVIPTCSKSGLTMSNGAEYISTELQGVYPDFAQSQAIKMLRGRFVNAIDIAQQRKVVVIGNETVLDLFKNHEDPIGKDVNVSGIMFKIIGVFETNMMNSSSEAYAPFSTLATIYNRGNNIDQITMNIKDIPTQEAMEEFMSKYIRASSYIHSFHPDDHRALWIHNQAGDNIQMNKAKNILHSAFWALGILTLISGVVGVSNIMLISVKERIREFGIRRAIGARPWSIIRMVMLESVVITAIFGYIGMLLGIFFCEWMDMTIAGQTMDMGVFKTEVFLDPTVDLSTCIRATIVIIVAGALAGFFPARKAVKIKPIDALRG